VETSQQSETYQIIPLEIESLVNEFMTHPCALDFNKGFIQASIASFTKSWLSIEVLHLMILRSAVAVVMALLECLPKLMSFFCLQQSSTAAADRVVG
jgi:hypothetical protein